MSREDLVEGYTSGRLSRRVFVKGLVALGVTGTAAVAYANALGAAPAARTGSVHADVYDVYPPDVYPPDVYPPVTPSDPTDVAGAGAAAPVAAQPGFTG